MIHAVLQRLLSLQLLLTCSCGLATAQVELATLRGSADQERFGHALTAVFDRRPASVTPADALVVGAPGATALFGPSATGQVTVYRLVAPQPDPGNPGLVATNTGTGVVVSTSSGVNTGDQFGYSLAGGFDRDGDGVTDLMIGSPGADLGSQVDVGLARIQSGLSAFPAPFPVTTSTAGLGQGYGGGETVACLGDIDNSGTLDYAFGAPGSAVTGCGCTSIQVAGSALVVDGESILVTSLTMVIAQTTGRLSGGGCCAPPGTSCPCYNDRIGAALAALGDLDGDGAPEFAVGNANWGRVLVVGLMAGTIGVKATLPVPGSGFSGFARTVAGLGDILGNDGIPELAVGAPAAGKVLIYSGATLLAGAPPDVTLDFSTHAPNGGGSFGAAICNPGDCDGDGVDDILVGAPDAATAAGSAVGHAFLFSGADRHLLGLVTGDAPGDGLGSALTGLPDLTGDGNAEFAVAAPYADREVGGQPLQDVGMVRVMTLDPAGSVGAALGGTDCAYLGSGAPRISLPNGLPHPGHDAFSLGAAGGQAGSLGALVLGFGTLQPPALLPIPTPGCLLYVAPQQNHAVGQFGGLVPGQGAVRFEIPVPTQPVLTGLTFRAQWYLSHGNATDGALTNLVEVTVQ